MEEGGEDACMLSKGKANPCMKSKPAGDGGSGLSIRVSVSWWKDTLCACFIGTNPDWLGSAKGA